MKIASPFLLVLMAAPVTKGVKPATTKYNLKGLGAHGYASASWDDPCLTTYLSVSAHEQVTKSGGSPTPTKYASVGVETYNTCTDEFTGVSVEIPAPSLQGSLRGATIQAAFTEAEKCHYEPDLDEFLCELVPFEGSVSASFTPVGAPYKDRFHQHFSFPGFRYGERAAGTTVDANVTFAGTILDGVPFVAVDTSGYIHKYTSGIMTMTKFY